MTKEQLIERQIYVRQRETELHLETQKLLFDILSRMTTEQKDKLKGYNIDDGYCGIDDNISSGGFDVIDDDGNIFYHPIDDLSQIQQKELIDHIIINNLFGS
jgi:hypothetical protein